MTLYSVSIKACDIFCKRLYTSQMLVVFTGLGSAAGRVSVPRSGGTGFDPGPVHTKVVNNGTTCSCSLEVEGEGLGLVSPKSV